MQLLLDGLRGVPEGFLSLFRLFAAAVGQEGAVSGAGRVTSLACGARATETTALMLVHHC